MDKTLDNINEIWDNLYSVNTPDQAKEKLYTKTEVGQQSDDINLFDTYSMINDFVTEHLPDKEPSGDCDYYKRCGYLKYKIVKYSCESANSYSARSQINYVRNTEERDESDEDIIQINEAPERNNRRLRTNGRRSAFNSIQNFGQSARCYVCCNVYDKNSLFIHMQDHRSKNRDNYICLRCSVILVNNIRDLRDWEISGLVQGGKRCRRCHCNRSLNRFREGLKYCTYCSLKKKYWNIRNKLSHE